MFTILVFYTSILVFTTDIPTRNVRFTNLVSYNFYSGTECMLHTNSACNTQQETTNTQQSANCCFLSHRSPSSPSKSLSFIMFSSCSIPFEGIPDDPHCQHQRISHPLVTTSSSHPIWWSSSSSIPGSFTTQ